MSSPAITYVIHVAATPETLWETLTSPAALRKFWGKIESPWTVGSTVTEVGDAGNVLWTGDVVRSEPPRLLSFTFDVIGSGEPPTEATFELSPPVSKVAPNAPVVRLTLSHAGFEDSSKLFPGCGRAWPEILSSLKTLVETGRPLAFLWKH